MSKLQVISLSLFVLVATSCTLQREQLSPRLEAIEIQPRWSQAATETVSDWYAPLRTDELGAALTAVLTNNPQLTGVLNTRLMPQCTKPAPAAPTIGRSSALT